MKFAIPSRVSASRRPGFTLIEILVSTGVGVILLGVVLSVMQVGGDGYGKTSRRIDTNVEARSALRIFYDDLTAAQFDDYFGSGSVSTGRWPTNEIWFTALMPRNAQEESKASGDLCFVYYYTAVTGPLDESGVGPFSRKLYRRFISSEDVMAVLKGEKTPAEAGLPSPLKEPSPEPEQREQDEAVAFNVLQFLVEPLEVNDVGKRVAWTRTTPTDGQEVDDEKPDLVKITLRVADNETAGQLTKASDWEAGGTLTDELLGSAGEPGRRLRSFEMTIPCGR